MGPGRSRDLWLVLGLLACLAPSSALARPLAAFDLTVAGLGLAVGPATQQVPKGVTSTVTTQLVLPHASIPLAALQKLLPQDLTVKGELSGPAFATPLTLSAPAGTPLTLPTLALKGTYTLRNLRLVAGTQDLLAASPSVVTIEAIDEVLVTKVLTRPLSLDEIQQRGIAVDQSNYTVVNFTAAVGTLSNQVKIDFPVVLPKAPMVSGDGGGIPPEPPALNLPSAANPNLVAKPIVFVPVLPPLEGEDEVELPPIPALLVFPGNIGFLHQFFQALLIVTNGAPEGSSLFVQDVIATIALPPGEDQTPGTDEAPGDDPLRVARVEGQGFVHALPVKAAGPDGQFGTNDDEEALAPGMTGHADFSVEGLKEGVHEVRFDIAATLVGLPRGPVPITGRARGAILVRNPNFALTLSHPNVVRRGEAYDLFATLTNTSQADANLVSISLDPRGVSGAQLLSESRVEFQTIRAGESATAKFSLQAQRTGQVTATSVQSDEGLLGRFNLRAGVGELGIPLSPDTLVLPTFANTLPEELLEAAMGLLGQAHSVATAPEGALPATVARIPRDTVTRMATALSEAGLRIRLGEPALRSLQELLVNFVDGMEDAAFDSLRRRSSQGAKLAAAAGAALAAEAAAQGLLDAQQALAASLTAHAPHLSVAASPGLSVRVDDGGGSLGTLAVDGPAARGIAFGEHLPLAAGGALRGSLDLVTRLAAAQYTVRAAAAAAGTADLGVVFPNASGGLEQVRFAAVPVQAGSVLTLTLAPGAANACALAVDDTGDGRADRALLPTAVVAIPDRGPEVVSVVQVVDQFPPQRSKSGLTTQLTDKFGRLVGILFSERVDPATASAGGNYAVEANQITQVLLQPSGRLVVLFLKNSLGPFVPRTLTVSGLADARGNPLAPASVTRTITPTIGEDGGILQGSVRGADGSGLPGAAVTVQQEAEDDFGFLVPQTVAELATDAQGRYQVDFVRGGGFTVSAVAPGGGDRAALSSALTEPGQRMNVDLVMLGRGTVAGTVRSAGGVPVANGVVALQAIQSLERFATRTAGDGSYRIARVPVGGFTLTACDADGNRGYAAGTLATAGGTATADVTVLPPVATVSLSGRVFRADGITPLPGVPVVLSVTPSAGNSFQTFVYSDAAAAFRFTDLPAGTLALRAYDPATGESGQATVSLAPGESQAVAVVFSGLGSISGQVVRASGAPVPAAKVVAGAHLVTADAAGRFTIGNVPVGSVTVSAQDPETGNIGRASAAVLTPGQVVQVTVLLPAVGTITGRVFEADGVTPIPGADVRIVNPMGYFPASLDASGQYRFENWSLGTYQLVAISGNFVAAASVTLAADGQVVRKDFLLSRGTGRVTGTVTDQGSNNQPAAATVTLWAQVPGRVGTPEMQPFANVVSDAYTGRFEFTNVPLGPVSVSAKSVLRPNPASASGTLSAAGQVLDFPLLLKANAGSISGTALGTDGTPAGAGIRLSVQGEGLPVVTVTTDAGGHYNFAPILPQGGYTLTAEDPVSGLKGQAYVSVTAGQDVKVNPRLLGKGSVLVTVREASGAPVPEGTVELAGGTFLRDQATGILTPDRQGQFRFANITEGPFSVTARDARGLQGLATGSIPAAGAEAAVTIILTPAGTITGRFLFPDGTGVPGAQVTLTDAGGTPRAFTTTASDAEHVGRFAFPTVPVGSYGLQGFDPATGRRGASGVRVDRDGQAVTADFAAVSLGTVTGTVFAGDGTTRVAGADVRIAPTGLYSQAALTQSGPDGTFTFPGVSAGGFTVQASDPVTLLAGSAKGSLAREAETVSIAVLLEPSGSVEGCVRRADGMTPVANAQVTLIRPGTTFTRSTQSAADGRYAFTHVPVGDIRLDAREPAGIDLARAAGHVGGEGDVVTADLTMVGTGTLAGTLVESNGVDPVAGGTVTARSLGPNPLTLSTATAPDGTFRFDRFPVGSFSLTARSVGGGLGAAATGTMGLDATMDIRMVLEASGSVIGLVLMPDGTTPARGAVVTLTSPRLTVATRTEAGGRFLLEAIPLGALHLDLLDPVGGGIQKADGSLTLNGQTWDTGTLILDDQAIAVTAVTPLDGAVDVPVATPVIVTFSEKVLRTTVTATSIRVLVDGSAVAGSLGFAANDTQVVFTPSQPLAGAKRYALQVTTAVTDLVGHPLVGERVTSFTTLDNIAPTVTGFSPAADATQVDPAAVVRVAFSEALDAGSVAADSITVTGPDGPVAGRVDVILNNTVVVFTPLAPLAPNALYGVKVASVRDRAGNSLAAQPTRSFATIDTLPPAVTSLSLPDGARTIEARPITLTAVSPDVDVARVEFFADATSLGTVTARPYTLTATLPAPTTADRSMVLSAIAVDRVGNRGPAASLAIAVEPPLPTVTSLLPAVLSLEMGGAGNLTVTISRVQPADTSVALVGSRADVASVPASVVVPAGQPDVAIPITVGIPGIATITASLNDTSAQSTVTVTPVGPTIASLRPGTLSITQGSAGILTLALTAAPAADAEVMLTSTNPAVVGLPPTARVIIPAGQTEQAFAVFGGSPGQAAVVANFNYTSALAQATVVTPQAAVVSLLPPVLPLAEGSRGALTVRLAASQPTDTAVHLSTSAPDVVGLPAGQITVPAHQHTATVYVAALARGLATVTAALGDSEATAAIAVVPAPATLDRLDCPAAAAEAATVRCTATLSAAQAADTAIPLSTSDPAVVQVPASVTVAAGSRSADAGVTALAQGTASVTAGPLNGSSRTAELQVVTGAVGLAGLLAESPAVHVGASTVLTLRLTAAPAADTPVSLSVSPPSVLAVAGTATVPAGRTFVDLTITGVEAGTATVTAGPVNGTTAQAAVAVNQLGPALTRIAPAALTLPKGTADRVEVTIAPTQLQPTVVPVTSSDPAAEVPTQVTVPSGESTVGFPVLGRVEGGATLTAGPLGGASQQATVTVTAARPQHLTLSPPAASIGRGETHRFTATATFTDTTSRDVTGEATWASSNPGVAAVLSPGTLEGIAEGQVMVTATLDGVQGAAPLGVTLWPSTGPVVTAVTPDRGTVGTAVQIFGTGFSPRASDDWVAFNGVPAPVTAASETALTATVPAGASTGPVTVTVGGRTATAPEPFTLLQTFAITPTEVTVTLSGSAGFRATLDGVAASGVTWRVNGVPGGSSSLGTIGAGGYYTAPATLPAVLPLQVEAVLTGDPSRIVTAIVQIVTQTSGVLGTAAVSVGVVQPGGANVLAGPVSVGVTQPISTQVLSGPVSVGVERAATAQASSPPVSVTAGPVIAGIAPASGGRGATVTITITGLNLAPLHGSPAVLVLRDGVPDATVTASGASASPDGTSVTCTLTIGSGAVAGARVIQVGTAQGRSSNLNLATNVFTVQ